MSQVFHKPGTIACEETPLGPTQEELDAVAESGLITDEVDTTTPYERGPGVVYEGNRKARRKNAAINRKRMKQLRKMKEKSRE